MKNILLTLASLAVAHTACARYIQPDPIGLAGGLNPFVYVNANPLGEIDPEGLQSWRRPNRPGWPAWAQPVNPSAMCTTGECAAGFSPLRPTPYGSPDFNKDPCVLAYLRENYGNLTTNTLIPNFSGLSYIPGSGDAATAWAGMMASGTTKGVLVTVPQGVGIGVQAMGAAGAGVAGGSSSPALIAFGSAASAFASGASTVLLAAGTGVTSYSTAANAAALLHCNCRR